MTRASSKIRRKLARLSVDHSMLLRLAQFAFRLKPVLPVMAVLAAAKLRYDEWFKFVLPLWAMLFGFARNRFAPAEIGE